MGSNDPTFDMWQATLLIQVVQCLSLVTVCVPVLKPFLDSLESGQLRADDLRRQNKSGYGYNRSQEAYQSNLNSGSRSASKPNRSIDALASATLSHRSKMHELGDLSERKQTAYTVATAAHDPGAAWDRQSHTSQTGLIHQTKTWTVEAERKNSVTSSE